MKLRISDITIGDRHRKDMGNLTALAESIAAHGLLHPPVVTTARNLVCGARRIAAALLLGWDEIEVRVIDPDDLIAAESDENECRKDFTPSERVAIAKTIKERIGQRQGQRTDKGELQGNCPEVEPGKQTRDTAAKAAGFDSTDELRRAETVVEKGVPELVEAMDAGDVSVSAAAEVAKLPKAEQKKTVKAGPEAVKEKAKEQRQKRKGTNSKGAGRGTTVSEQKPDDKPADAEPDAEQEPGPPAETGRTFRDALGRTIPPTLRDTFYDAELAETIAELAELKTRLDARYQRLIRSLSRKPYPFCLFGDAAKKFAEVVHPKGGLLTQTIDHLRCGVPYVVCPQCGGRGTDCKVCRFGGYLPEWRHNELTNG